MVILLSLCDMISKTALKNQIFGQEINHAGEETIFHLAKITIL